MRTIEEIKDDLSKYFGVAYFTESDVEQCHYLVNELIETVATLQREKCSEEATITIECDKDKDVSECYRGEFGEFVYVNLESILNAKL